MENHQFLESKLTEVEQGAVAFQVLAWTFVLLGVVLAGVGALQAVELVRAETPLSETLVRSVGALLNSVVCFMLFWFLRRAGTLFCTMSALIREMREVV